MAKIGGQQLPPALPRGNAPGPAGSAPPATTPQAPAAQAPPQAPAAAPKSAAVNAQLVAQQFGSAFISAGRLAGQLVKGLVNPSALQLRRAEKQPPSEKVEDAKGEAQGADAEQGPSESGDKSPIMSAFAALKRTRLFRFRKTVRKVRGGGAEIGSQIILGDDYHEKERDHQRARHYLGDDQEESSFDQAKREALFLQHLENLGEPPTRLARYLNSLLGVSRDREFKHLLADQVRPQMDSMAGRIEQIDTDERRSLAALISRAAHQVGVRSSENFARLLSATGAAEAALLVASTEDAVGRAAQFDQALRRAASPTYRVAVIEAGFPGLERLGGDTVGLPPEKLHLVWVSLLRAAENVELDTLATMAEALVAGVFGKGGPDAVLPLSEALSSALKVAPGGGSLVVQLLVTYARGGQEKAAEHLAGMLRDLFRHARGNCVPILTTLRDRRASPSAGAGDDALLRELEGHVPLLAALIPTCSRVLEKGQAIPPEAAAVLAEALLAVATLNIVGDTAAGQQLLRRAALAQERGSETFLTTLPRAALTLAQPKLVKPLWDSGLTPAHFQFGGRPFLERVALYTGRAVASPILARTHKGDASAAKVLLRSSIRVNAALFGLTPDGAYLAAEALEALRDRPTRVALKGTLFRMGKIRKKYSLGQHPGSIDPFQDLVSALASNKGGLGSNSVPRQTAAELIP